MMFVNKFAGVAMLNMFKRLCAFIVLAFLPVMANATTFTTTVPGLGIELPDEYPEAGGVAFVLIGANGNIYYQFSNPAGAFRGYQYRGNPSRFNGNPFTINDPLTLDCGFATCTTYFGGSIAQVHIRFSAWDGDTQVNGFDEDDISLILNGVNVGNWSDVYTEKTNNAGTQSFGFEQGFGNNAFNTGWFSTTNSALLNDILTTGQTTTQVYDDDPNDNYWDFRRGSNLPNNNIQTVAPGYTLEKTADKTDFLVAGETINYQYIITNIGSVPIRQLAVSDDKIPSVSCDKSVIQDTNPGGTADFATCTATYTVSQADVDNGSVTNIAKATGVPDFGELGTLTDTVTVNGPTRTAELVVDKTSTLTNFGLAGTSVPYSIALRNDGNTTLKNISVNDPLLPGLVCSPPDLLPAGTFTCSGNYTVLQSDIDQYTATGKLLENTVTVEADTPHAGRLSRTDTLAMPGVFAELKMALTKTAQTANFSAVGDVLTYQIKIDNTGDVSFPSAPTITDVLTGGATCPAGPVAPGNSVICTASYTVDQDDLDAGKVDNTASAAVTVGSQTANGNDDATVPAVITRELTLDKRLAASSPTEFDATGVTLSYEYVLTNGGNVTLLTPSVADDRTTVSCPATQIAAGTSITCTATYDTVQGDLNRGGVTNKATANATAAGPGAVGVSSAEDTVTVPADQKPALELKKTAPTVNAAGFQQGNTVTYSFEVKNIGNIRISNGTLGVSQIEIVDDKIGTFNCQPTPLNVGATITCTADYVLTANDVLAGAVVNTAKAKAGTVESDQVSATIAPTLSPGISMSKAATTASVTATTDSISYTFTVTNTGDTQILRVGQPITINDPALSGPADCSAQPLILNNGDSFQCSGTRNGITQAELDAGQVDNSATASFPFVNNGTQITVTSDESTASVPVVADPKMVFTKTGPAVFNALNQSLSYTFAVENTGNVTLKQVTVTDPLIPALNCVLTNIAPTTTSSCTGTYMVTQPDVDAAVINNTASVTAIPAQGSQLTATDTATATADPTFTTKTATLAKAAVLSAFTKVGDQITYTMTVKNTGTQTLSNLVVLDALDSAYRCEIASLAPTVENTNCSFIHTVTQADIDAGEVKNDASLSSTEITTQNADVTVPGPTRTASFDFAKTANTTFTKAGDQIVFTFRVENTGNTTLSNVTVADPFFGSPLNCTGIGSLAPGAVDNTTCTTTYTVTQPDVDAGQITNTATVSVDAPTGVTKPTDKTSTAVVTGPTESASIDVTKASADGVYAAPTDSEVFTFSVTNTGNVTLSSLVLTDSNLGFTCPLADLAPQASTTTCANGSALTATKNTTQADVDAGSYSNTVKIAGSSKVKSTAVSDEATVTIKGPAQAPAMTLVKSSTFAGTMESVGDVLTYNYVVTNSGNITLTAPITVTDDKIPDVDCPTLPAAGIAPGGTYTCTGDYTVTQVDLDAGQVVNVATSQLTQPIVPTTPGGTPYVVVTSPQATETVSATQKPALRLLKRVKSGSPSSYDKPTDQVTFEYVVTNSGNVTITDAITVTDDKIPGTLTCAAAGSLAPGGEVTCEQVWTAVQKDVDDGSVTNMATANTTHNSNAVASNTGSVTITAVQNPMLGIVKTFTGTSAPGTFNENDVLSYTIVVTNSGNVTIDGPITLTDSLTTPNCPALVNNKLLPNETLNCTATHSVTQNDLDLGSATNVVSAAGTFNGNAVQSPSDDATYPDTANPAMTLTKTARATNVPFNALNQVITYDYEVTNTGNVGLSGLITIEDDVLGTINCKLASDPAVATGGKANCTATHTITQADLDRGFVTNNATAQTTYPPSSANPTQVVSPNADATVQAAQNEELTVAKTQTTAYATGASAGDPLTYQITATNTGNQTISGVAITDPLVPTLTCEYVANGAAPVAATANVVLAPLDALVCRGPYTVLQTDVDKQTLVNTATANGTDPQGQTITGSGMHTQTLAAPNVDMLVTKTVTPEPGPDAAFSSVDEELTFTIAVKNTGNITLRTATVTDTRLVTPVNCTIGPIVPGATDDSCEFIYKVTQADIDALNTDANGSFGGFTNTANVNAVPDNTNLAAIDRSDDVFVRGPDREPAFSLVKASTTTEITTFGQVVPYTYTIANTGNVTLTVEPQIVDDKIGTFTCTGIPAGGLLPAEFYQCSANYTVTEADLDAGQVKNTATATSTQVTGNIVDDYTISVKQTPKLTVAKTASPSGNVKAGQTVTYTYVVKNEGNVSLKNVTLTDAHTSASGTATLPIVSESLTSDINETGTSLDSAPIGVWSDLKMGDTVTFTATYVMTQADVDKQAAVTNAASVKGTDPKNVETTGSASASVTPETKANTVEVTKTASTLNIATPKVGDIVTFEIKVENKGNQTLDNVTLTDALTDDQNGSLTLTSLPSVTNKSLNADDDIDVGETWTYSASYTLQQGAIDSGGINNTASVTTDDPQDVKVNDAINAPVEVTLGQNPGIAVVKSATQVDGGDGSMDAGDAIEYRYEIENTGDVTLFDLSVTETGFTGLGTAPTPTYLSGGGDLDGEADVIDLAVGAGKVVFNARYVLIQADVDAGSVQNSATAKGKTKLGTEVSDVSGADNNSDAPLVSTFARTPALEVIKLASPQLSTPAKVGDKVFYSINVKNTGNVTLNAPTLVDTLVTAKPDPQTIAAPVLDSGDISNIGKLDAGETWSYTAEYALTQDAIDAGGISNTVVASSNSLVGNVPVSDTSDDGVGPVTGNDPTVTSIPRTSGITVVKTGALDLGADGIASVGDVITYTYTVNNTGNTRLFDVGVTETTFSGVGAAPTPAVKTGGANLDGEGDALDLAVGTTPIVFEATYALQQGDIDAGKIDNQATATGQPPFGPAISDLSDDASASENDPTRVTIPEAPGIEIEKKADTTALSNPVAVNDVITFNVTVRNTGNVTLKNVALTEDFKRRDGTVLSITLTGPSGDGGTANALDQGESWTYTATHALTQLDIDAGGVQNQIDVSSTTDQGTSVTDKSDDGDDGDGNTSDDATVVNVGGVPSVSVVKQLAAGAPNPVSAVDQVIPYEFVVTNTGNITITAPVTIADPLIDGQGSGPVTCPAPPIAVGAMITCTGSYKVTLADLNTGQVANTATANVTQPVQPVNPGDQSQVVVSQPSNQIIVPATQTSTLAITKALDSTSPTSFNAVGNTLTYRYRATNTGNVTLAGPITITDDRIGAALACDAGPLAPGAFVECTHSDDAEQGDLNTGSITNKATGAAVFNGTPVVSAEVQTTVPAVQDPKLSFAKTLLSATPDTLDVGTDLAYQFVITNTGNVTIAGPFTITDSIADSTNCPVPAGNVLNPTDTLTCTGAYKLKAGDVKIGSVTNTATGSGSFGGNPVTSPSDKAVYPASVTPAIDLVKDSVPSDVTFAKAGDIVTYSYTLTNNSKTGLSEDISITDNKLPAAFVCYDAATNGVLNVGQSHTCTAPYTVKQEDLDAGEVINEATASTTFAPGTADETPVVSTPATKTVKAVPDAKLTMTKKTVAPPANAKAGDTITFEMNATNAGNQTISGVSIVDPKIGVLTCTVDGVAAPANVVLAPTKTLVCRGTYEVTQTDINAQSLTNTASVTGNDPTGTPVPKVDAMESVTLATPNPVLTVNKAITPAPAAGAAAFTNPNDSVQFAVTVKNDGNITLNNVIITDDLTTTPTSCTIATLAPGAEDSSCRFTMTVDQDDIDGAGVNAFGGFDNTARAVGTLATPTGGTTSGDDTIFVRGPDHKPSLSMVKNADLASIAAAGDKITYSYIVTNSGNLTLTAPISVADDKIANVNCPAMPNGGLAPNAKITCTAEYTVLQSDVDAGGITNIAKASSTQAPAPTTPSNETATKTVPVAKAPALKITKTPSQTSDVKAGTTITYTYTVENSGNQTITDVSVADSHVSASGTSALSVGGETLSTDTAPTSDSTDATAANGVWSVLRPKDIVTFTATYLVTQGDVDAQVTLANTATTSGKTPDGATTTNVTNVNVSVDPANPELTALKVVGASTLSTPPVAGEVVNFDITVTNSGNQKLTSISLIDDLRQANNVALPTPQPVFTGTDVGNDQAMAPGEVWTYTVTHTLTQDDIDAGGITNSVQARGLDPKNALITDTSDDNNPANGANTPAQVLVPASPSIKGDKTLTTAGTEVGDVVAFEITITNDGNVKLTNVAVATETLKRLDGVDLTPTSGPSFVGASKSSGAGTLLPGEVARYAVSYKLIQADLDAGGISNTALVTGTPPVGSPLTDTAGQPNDAPVTNPITKSPNIALAKTFAATSPASYSAVGTELKYLFTVTNTGNVTITDAVSIADPLITNAGQAITCDALPAGGLLPQGKLECTGSYFVTQKDIDDGTVNNTATATMGSNVSAPSSAQAQAQKNPALSFTKVGPNMEATSFITGAKAIYTFTTTNTGNTTITAPITVTDTLLDASMITCPTFPAAGIAPTGTYVCTGEYTVTATDVNLGSVTNVASASDGTTSSPLDQATIPNAGVPALMIEKTSGLSSFDRVGTDIPFSFKVTNSGTRAFASVVTVTDTLFGDVICYTPSAANPDLIAGESVTCSGTHRVTQADLNNGQVINEAFASTTFGSTNTKVLSPADKVTVPAVIKRELALEKTATTLPLTGVDQVLTYTLKATNNGNQTLTNVRLEDAKLSGFTCPAVTLVPTQSVSCSGTYKVTQADIDAGKVVNAAKVSGLTPQGVGVTGNAGLDLATPAAMPSMTMTKTAVTNPFGAVGTKHTYSFAVKNTGNVTLKTLKVTDSLDASYSCDIASLAPGLTDTTCSFEMTVTQEMVDNGSISNTARVTAIDPNGTAIADDDTISTNGPTQTPSIEATKVALPAPGIVGAKVPFQLTVANTGNVTLKSVTLTDTMTTFTGGAVALDAPFARVPASDVGGDNILSVGESWTYKAELTLTQGIVNAGGVNNQVSVTARDPKNAVVSDLSDNGLDSDGNTSDDKSVFTVPSAPQLTVVKSVMTAGSAVGDEVVFKIEGQNTGNVTLTGVTASDTLTRLNGVALTAVITPTVGVTLNSGDKTTWEVRHTLTQDDLDAGGLSNTALANGISPTGTTITDISSDDDFTDGNTADDPTQLIIAPAPAMDVLKVTTSIGMSAGEKVEYEITVRNTGTVRLFNINPVDTLTDISGANPRQPALTFVNNSATPASPQGTLLPGEVATYKTSVVLTQADVEAGGLSNQVTVTASTPLGGTLTGVSDTDGTGTDDPTIAKITPAPALTLAKTIIGRRLLFPTVEEMTFRIAVTNTGNINQTGLVVQDDLASFATPARLINDTYPLVVTSSGFTGGAVNPAYNGSSVIDLLTANPGLAPGATGIVEITLVISTASGFPTQANVATAASDQVKTPVSGSFTLQEIDSDGDGIPDTLENADRDGDGIPDKEDYDPTGNFFCEDDGRIIAGGSITVTGQGFTRTGVGTTGPIVIVRDGSDGNFQFFVTAPGTYNLSFTYPPVGAPSTTRFSSGHLDATSLLPANPAPVGSSPRGLSGFLTDPSAAANRFYTSFTFEAGDPFVINNNVPLTQCVQSTPVVATKQADRNTAVFGETVNYTLTFRNDSTIAHTPGTIMDTLPPGIFYTPGTARIDGVAVEPTVTGRTLNWSSNLNPAQMKTVTFAARIGRTGGFGNRVNSTWFQNSAGTRVSNVAQAAVRVDPEHVFDCSDIIGKVFDDKNSNGYQDPPSSSHPRISSRGLVPNDDYVVSNGKFAAAPKVVNRNEPGLPGVRLVTPNGTIITTDEYGRYSVPCAALPKNSGSNFQLKLDTRSLPSGYRVTTENPRNMRVTAGKVAKMNFGAALSQVVSINLNSKAFNAGSSTPNASLEAAVDGLLAQIQNTPSVLRFTYLLESGEPVQTGRTRLKALEQMVRSKWRRIGKYKLIIERTLENGT